MKDETFIFSRTDPGPELQSILMSKLVFPGDRPRIQLEDATLKDVKTMVGDGDGITLTWEGCSDPNDKAIVYRDVQDGAGPSHADFAAYWRESNPNPALRPFLALLRERYPDLLSAAIWPGATD